MEISTNGRIFKRSREPWPALFRSDEERAEDASGETKVRFLSMNFDNDGSCSPVACTRTARAAAFTTTTALEVEEEKMEDGSTTVALPFRLGNSLCENRPVEVTRFKLITDTAASFQLDPSDATAAMVEGREGDVPKSMLDDILVSAGPDTERLGAVAPASDDDDETGSVGPEPSVASDTSSIAGALDDLGNFDVGFDLGISCSMDVDAVKNFEILAAPVVEELRVDVLDIGVEYGQVKGLASVEPMEVQETRVTGPRSLFLKDCVPLWGCISICGRRPEMEDAVVAVPRFFDIPLWMLISDHAVDGLIHRKISLPSHFFGVYDGHGGSQVANYCQERIHLTLADKLASSKEGFEEIVRGSDWQKQWERAFNDCFLKIDDEVGGKVSRVCSGSTSEASGGKSSSDPVAPETVGSTAVVSVICSSHIIVANCGDSRAVLCRGKQAMPLSVDHKPNREDEYARIEAAGGKVIQWNGYRVFGVLAMSRSIGDRYLKPWIIPEPEVRIIPRMKDDECLILASDGLWDVLSNEEVCEAARRRLLLWHKKNVVSDPSQRGLGPDPASQAAAEYLSKLALQKGSKDNITVIVIDLKSQRKFKPKN